MTINDVYKLIGHSYQVCWDAAWYDVTGFNEEECYLEACEGGAEVCVSLEELAKQKDIAFYELRQITLDDVKGNKR